MKYVFASFVAFNATYLILIFVSWLLRDIKGETEPYFTYLLINFAAYCILDKLDDLKIKP